MAASKDSHWYLGATPSKKSVQRVKTKIGDVLKPGNMGAWPTVRDRLNRLLIGWSAYFGYGTRLQAYRAINHYVYDGVRHFLVRRHNVQARHAPILPCRCVRGTWVCCADQVVRKHLARTGASIHVASGRRHCRFCRFDERGGETERPWAATAPFLDSTEREFEAGEHSIRH